MNDHLPVFVAEAPIVIDLEVSASFVDCYVVDPVVGYVADQMIGVVLCMLGSASRGLRPRWRKFKSTVYVYCV